MYGFLYITILIFLSIACISVCNGQVAGINKKDSIFTTDIKVDTLLKKIKSLSSNIQSRIKREEIFFINSLPAFNNKKTDSVFKTLTHPFSLKNQFKTKPFIKFNGGYNTYNFNYRSYIDTPIAEINIYQHYATGSLGFSMGILPFRVNYLFSKSNSVLFRDITDVQIVFDANQYKANLYSGLKKNLLFFADKLKDSLLEINYKTQLNRLNDLSALLNTPLLFQKLTEYREIINIPNLNYDINLSDSMNKYRIDSAQAVAKFFLDNYDTERKQFDSVKTKVDSLKQLYEKMVAKINTVRGLLNKKLTGEFNFSEMEKEIKKLGIREKLIPEKYSWLLNMRKMGIGRNLINYSELTSKNVGLKGVDFEYSSKRLYAAVAAGTVDYRYRYYGVNSGLKSHQYMYMMRIGKGRVDRNHFFITYYKGQKQVYFSTSNNQKLLVISGISGELKYLISKNIGLYAEIAESMSADLKSSPVSYSKFSVRDNKNKAVSLKLNSYFPKTNTRIDALYKFTGANFQSFSSFQTNSALKAWHIKIDQNLLKRKLKITAAIRTNDFYNPYILQQYNSTTVFKSLQATYHAKHFPTISFGYSPVSQLTKLDNQIIDNQFNSLNGLLTHYYKLGIAPSSSSFMYNKFYNNNSDTGFAYYNASNIFFNQTVAFAYYTMNIALSQSKSRNYELNVFDGGLQSKLGKIGHAGFGVKVNNFNKKETKTSLYGNLQLNLRRWGILNMVYDNGFIPGSNKTFIKNDMFNLVFTQSF